MTGVELKGAPKVGNVAGLSPAAAKDAPAETMGEVIKDGNAGKADATLSPPPIIASSGFSLTPAEASME